MANADICSTQLMKQLRQGRLYNGTWGKEFEIHHTEVHASRKREFISITNRDSSCIGFIPLTNKLSAEIRFISEAL